jgi:hypothetical protein
MPRKMKYWKLSLATAFFEEERQRQNMCISSWMRLVYYLQHLIQNRFQGPSTTNKMLHSSLTLAILWACAGHAQSPPPYPDLVSSVSLHPGSVPVLPDLDFRTWVVDDGASSSTFEADGLTYQLIAQGFAADGPVGSLTGGVFEEVYTIPNSSLGERMVGAGITPVESRGSMKLIVSGLPDGQYQFTSFFNSWTEEEVAAAVLLTFNRQMHDLVSSQALKMLHSPWQYCKIYEQTIQGKNWNEASITVTPVNVVRGSLEVVFDPYAPGNIFFTGFEINGVPPWDSMAYPSPENRETGVDAPNGQIVASWTPTPQSPNWDRDFKVYFGPSADELQLITTQKEHEILFTGKSA